MNADRRRILDLVVTMQQAFLDTPALRLTVGQAQRRFGASGRRCRAVLDLLLESGVLDRTPQAQYVRLFPLAVRRAA